MLFNSYEFVFLFLPVCLLVFAALGAVQAPRLAVAWLTVASMAFYAVWNPWHLPLFLASMAVNYLLGAAIAAYPAQSTGARAFLTLGVVSNLLFLGWFKYAGFFVETITGDGSWIATTVLPLGISFYVFHQIFYLMDVYRDPHEHCGLFEYGFYIAFFPALIAGPLLRPSEVLPQIRDKSRFKFTEEDFGIGLTIFVFGLTKKVMLADLAAKYANSPFDATAVGGPVAALNAWTAVLAYSIQLYFDFSGYSDMAIGLARMFGVKLPQNFNAPYQSTSIGAFWRRWHITLGRLLREGIYFPLGGGRVGPVRRSFNLLAVMTIGGLWHGAGWTFILWGVLHGVMLAVNHAWSDFAKARGWTFTRTSKIWRGFAWALTFTGVILAWVLFRAADLGAAGRMYAAMFGAHGWLPTTFSPEGLIVISVLLSVTLFAPTTQRIMAAAEPALDYVREKDESQPLAGFLVRDWAPNWSVAVAAAAALTICTIHMSGARQFLYFNF